MKTGTDAQMLSMINSIVEQHGCRLKAVDLDNYRIELEGPEDKKVACAMALAEVLD